CAREAYSWNNLYFYGLDSW
nr:immunoglobulin heavy chain junction region [Macaca mulatta]MOX61030.1 immunoglobulin heavy chain junction region [Macaca mulatta]MOX63576.1 immunoglobulin heavy chain junction region [Macaca mulatta]MOX64039.1 immunoglobulin heavy chain junction region [Macaca mulatta]MOX65910.1 immunoglobulin heavy chain junction region [Macaca mulatta]